MNNAGLNGGKGRGESKGAGQHPGQNGDGHAFVIGALGVNPFVTLPLDDGETAALGAGGSGGGASRGTGAQECRLATSGAVGNRTNCAEPGLNDTNTPRHGLSKELYNG